MNSNQDLIERTYNVFLAKSEEDLDSLPHGEMLPLLSVCNLVINISKNENERGALYKKTLDILYRWASGNSLDLSVRWHIYNLLTAELFYYFDTSISLGTLDQLYNKISLQFENEVAKRIKLEPNTATKNKLVVVTTSQFLGTNHSPTKRVLDYALTIQRDLKIPVYIINDALTSFTRCSQLEPSINLNHLERYNELKYFEYEGQEFSFRQVPANAMPNIDVCIELIRYIQLLNPCLVYNVGGSSLISDVCAKFTKTTCLPCSYDIPISRSKYLLVPRNLNDMDAFRLSRLDQDQQIIETKLNYSLPISSVEYIRKDLSLSDEAFVISIVGNRLASEVNEDLIKVLERLLQSNSNLAVLVIGKVIDDCSFKTRLCRFPQVYFPGFLADASQAIKVTDLYINPLRSGGGRSVFEALANGVPVLTPKFGDGYYTAGDDFSVNGLNEIEEVTSQYIRNKHRYRTMRKKALQRAAILANIVETQSEVLARILN